MNYNPFSQFAYLFETKTHPNARTLRTSLAQKLHDSFRILVGQPPALVDAKNVHAGLFDAFTLYIPFSLGLLMDWYTDNVDNSLLKSSFYILLVIINTLLLLTRLAFAAIATLVMSPLIAVVHGISSLIARQSHNDALSSVGKLQNGEEQSLGDYMNQHNLDLEELIMSVEKPIPDTNSSSYQLILENKIKPAIYQPIQFSISFNPHTQSPAQAINIHALFQLNVGNVVGAIEHSNIDDADKSAILKM